VVLRVVAQPLNPRMHECRTYPDPVVFRRHIGFGAHRTRARAAYSSAWLPMLLLLRQLAHRVEVVSPYSLLSVQCCSARFIVTLEWRLKF
jgi:hypothetical protein